MNENTPIDSNIRVRPRRRDLIEPKPKTLADVIHVLEGNIRLSPTRRRDLISAVNTVARWLNRNPEELDANVKDLRDRLNKIHPYQKNVSRKRFSNLKSDLKKALVIGLLRRTLVPRERSEQWIEFLTSLKTKWQRHSLARFATFCSSKNYLPSDVNDRVLQEFHAHLDATDIAKDPDNTFKITAQTWNGIVKGNCQSLNKVTTPSKERYLAIPLTDFPISFQEDVASWLDRLTRVDLWSEDGPAKAVKPVTARNIRTEIGQFATALVHQGYEIETITSLSVLIELKAFRAGLRFFINRNNDIIPTWLEGMASKLVAIARHHANLPDPQLHNLIAIKGRLIVIRPGMTEKNKKRLRQFDDLRNVRRLQILPLDLLARAEASDTPSRKIALRVMYAVAVEILLQCPMRIGNVSELNLEQHFTWRGQGHSQLLSIAIPGSEVKNGEAIEVDLRRDSTRLVRIYLKTYRPLISDEPGDWLFPMRSGPTHQPASRLSAELSKLIYNETGLIINAHLFRHLAGMLYLKEKPGHYETVRRLLGHRKLETTMTFYTDMEKKWAHQQYDDHVLSKYRRTP